MKGPVRDGTDALVESGQGMKSDPGIEGLAREPGLGGKRLMERSFQRAQAEFSWGRLRGRDISERSLPSALEAGTLPGRGMGLLVPPAYPALSGVRGQWGLGAPRAGRALRPASASCHCPRATAGHPRGDGDAGGAARERGTGTPGVGAPRTPRLANHQGGSGGQGRGQGEGEALGCRAPKRDSAEAWGRGPGGRGGGAAGG